MEINRYFEPLQSWLNSLQTRERNIVITSAIALAVMIFYLAVWDPVFGSLADEKQRYQSQQQTLQWMTENANKIVSLQSGNNQFASRFKNQSISSLAQRSAQSMGIKQNISKLDENKKGVKINLDQADFDRVILWLNDMEQKYSIQASSIHIEKQEKSGAVSVRVTLGRAE